MIKIYPNGLVCLDLYDFVLVTFCVGNTIGYVVRRKMAKRSETIVQDPIINELKSRSPRLLRSENGMMIKLPLNGARGGNKRSATMLFSLIIRSPKFAAFLRLLLEAKRKQRQLLFLRIMFTALNKFITNNAGIYIHISNASYDYVKLIMIGVSSTTTGVMLGLFLQNSIALSGFSLLALYMRDIEYVEYDNCALLCKAVQTYHNTGILQEMRSTIQITKDELLELEPPVYLSCFEEKTSLIQRYKLRELLDSKSGKRRIQHFSEFIKRFPECQPDTEALYKDIIETQIK